MKIFIGSSREAVKTMRQVATWLPRGVDVPWNGREAFRAGKNTMDELLRHCKEVDGAVFVFAEDDVVKIRNKVMPATRDNVWLEYGLFVGALGGERVQRIVVGNPRTATDMLGMTVIEWPKTYHKKKREDAKARIREWFQGLTPAYLKSLAFDVAAKLASGTPFQVSVILQQKAPAFMVASVKQIRALCSDKGKYSKKYYRKQFAWVKDAPKIRSLRRVFVAKTRGQKPKFSKGEWKGIQEHLRQNRKCSAIQARWVYDNDQWLGARYKDSLGFALFDEKWIVHWGVKFGYCYRQEQDEELGRHLAIYFESLWEHATVFDNMKL